MFPCGVDWSTMPLTTRESKDPPPGSLTTLTLSTLNDLGFSGQTATQASAICLQRKSLYPYCLLDTALWILQVTCSTSLASNLSEPSTTKLSKTAMHFSPAFSYPSTISAAVNPSKRRASALPISSPERVMTKLAPSPTSASCAFAACTMSFAAGWLTSTSRRMVEASLVTDSLPRWFTSSLFDPAGPMEVLVIRARPLQASMFFRTASLIPAK
mmetsp:Transcript_7410/g.26378  ORF Transcript_7410/g.26378 Transcript_7410/m.26378 type:complete len:214 (+) Transcript_7410:402-1043(+)